MDNPQRERALPPAGVSEMKSGGREESATLVAYLRDLPREELVAWCATRRGTVTQGHTPPEVADDAPAPIAEAPTLDPALTKVSAREGEALRLTTLGLTRGQIGEALYISPRTVSSHVYNARRKLSRLAPGALSLPIDQ